MDERLEEQLERMRQLSARVAKIHEELAHNTELMEQDRARMRGSPLQEVRDFRTWRQQHEPEAPRTRHRPERATAAERPRSRRRSR
jgi:hypothetical protein